MDKLKERSEVNASDKWQIEKIYKNIEEFKNISKKEINNIIDMYIKYFCIIF